MPELGPGQKPISMPHYPHLLIEDTLVWTKFLAAAKVKISRVWYDVRVGSAVILPPEASDMERKIAAGITRKRIDVVALTERNTWIIEVKPYANMYSVGQILTYVRLFESEYTYEGSLTAVIVCDDYDDDLIDEFEEFGILVLKNI